MSSFLQRLHEGRPTLMLPIRSGRTPDVVRIARATGHHAVMIDLEHSTMSLDVAAQLCATAADLGLTPFVRVQEREYGAIGRLLDCGAQGIVAPRVDTALEARTVARACRFPPRGQRSQLAMVPMLDMRPTPAAELNPWLDESTIVQILVETPDGVAGAREIAAIDGVDMLGIGANDLTAELGSPGDHTRIRSHVAEVAQACREHGKLLQLGGVGDLQLLKSLLPLGVCPLFMTGTDTDLLYAGASARAGLVLKEFS
ncbi:aldolase/citrate lyase family protein [Lentzea sp. BCCO 10_0856]|uniref:Aldolase/citrate lyase family protein n=1 Tax=Lentzea miocenica TaxID=3095431 RepID=A0ABU4T3W0_9PSEU|nr:aldolase/citrate lyase family protein [Lentzea sp. BCCO 10_0856]MDX8032633.1 aldolase/citrate lyase family protein [Lentzea sp. BCCO 10_0856]